MALTLGLVSACSTSPAPGADASLDASNDLGPATDAGAAGADVQPLSTAHCQFVDPPANGNTGATVSAGAITAGAAEDYVDLPVGSALGAYTGRAKFFGNEGFVDARTNEYAAWFNPSVGVETRTRVRALALSAGGETVLILKADLGAADTNVAYDVAAALGPAYAGKVIFATSHSHSAPGHTIANEGLATLGFGPFRNESYRRLVAALTAVARQAIEARVAARVGISHDANFDPMNTVSRDRRRDNDDLPRGRDRKDSDLFVLRVDTVDGAPMAVVPIFGVHPTVLGGDNNLISGDVSTAIERSLEESFDRRVVVMHLQGAAGDVSPGGSGGMDCGAESRGPARFCYDFSRVESVGRLALPLLRRAWEAAGTQMQRETELEMVTRSVALGPDWRTFTVRDGGLSYSDFNPARDPDGRIFDDAGAVLSPVDEFGAPAGAALCGNENGNYPPAAIRGSVALRPYRTCNRVDIFTRLVNTLVLPYEPVVTPNQVLCGSTRTAVAALRIGAHLFVTLPGEPLTLLADRARALSPVAPENTVVIGYANGHVGYLLTADDWLRGGYEPNINFWGPLEGEYIVERAMELARLAVTPTREDGQRGGASRWVTPPENNSPPAFEAGVNPGTVPAAVPPEVFSRRRVFTGENRITRAQPAERVARLASARFVFLGVDALTETPTVTVERETAPDQWAPLTRRSGRTVVDGDVLLMHTPLPLEPVGRQSRSHYWVAEWQVVTPYGTGDDALEDRAAVALGRYRFRARGAGYNLTSSPFTVEPATLVVSAIRAGTAATVTARYQAAEGWRLLGLRNAPGEAVDLQRSVTVEATLRGGGTRRFESVSPAAPGRFSVELGGDAPNVTGLRVLDGAGNSGLAALN